MIPFQQMAGTLDRNTTCLSFGTHKNNNVLPRKLAYWYVYQTNVRIVNLCVLNIEQSETNERISIDLALGAKRTEFVCLVLSTAVTKARRRKGKSSADKQHNKLIKCNAVIVKLICVFLLCSLKRSQIGNFTRLHASLSRIIAFRWKTKRESETKARKHQKLSTSSGSRFFFCNLLRYIILLHIIIFSFISFVKNNQKFFNSPTSLPS